MLETRVYLLRGMSGSGKSTFIEKYLKPRFDHLEVLSADRFFADESGAYNFDAEYLSEAHNACYKSYKEALEAQFERFQNETKYRDMRRSAIVVDNTNLEMYEIAPYFMEAQTIGAFPEILSFGFWGTVNDHLSRQVHGLKLHSLERQWEKLAQTTYPPHWKPYVIAVRPTKDKFVWRCVAPLMSLN